MCIHNKPTRNDEAKEYQYGLENRAPEIQEGDKILFDECGRCAPQINGKGDIDYHSYHFRLVQWGSGYSLLVRHGGGDERIFLGYNHTRISELIAMLPSSDARYLMLYALYRANNDGKKEAFEENENKWKRAVVDKRIKSRRYPSRGIVKVWIENN